MKFRLGIRQQVLLIALLPAALIACALTLYFILSGLSSLDQEQQERGNAVARYLAPAAEYDLVAGNRGGLQMLVQTAMSQRNVTAVSVVDPEGRTLALSGKTALSPMFLLKRAGGLKDGMAGMGPGWQAFAAPVTRSHAEIEDYLDGRARSAAQNTPDVVGWVFVEISTVELESRKHSLLSNSALILLGGLLLTGALAWRMASRVVQPVLRLAEAVRSMAAGELDVRVPSDSAGELGALEAGFNDMAISLQDIHTTLQDRIDHATAQLSHQARHDPLTGLINRREFEARAEAAIQSAQNLGGSHALCYLDLDQFKIVNDSCGHAAGDDLLRQLSQLLRGRIRGQDILGRLGGDEFGVLLENCLVEDAMRVTESLRQLVQDFRFFWHDKVFVVGVSIGVVMIDARTKSLHEVLSAADRACYAAKDGGRNRVVVFSQDDASRQQEQRDAAWATRISSALEENRLTLHAQAIHAIGAHGTPPLHAEFLLRMVAENGELIPPMAFLPSAERFALMTPLDHWAITHACTLIARASRTRHGSDFSGSVNLAVSTLCEPDFLPFIESCLASNGLQPGQLCFEISEAATTRNYLDVQRFARAVRAMGCRLALGDFGSGLASFSHLQNLAPDFVKIGGTLVHEAVGSEVGRTLLRAVVEIALKMNITVIAERVDALPVRDMLQQMGISWVQGDLYGAPQPSETLLELSPRGTLAHLPVGSPGIALATPAESGKTGA